MLEPVLTQQASSFPAASVSETCKKRCMSKMRGASSHLYITNNKLNSQINCTAPHLAAWKPGSVVKNCADQATSDRLRPTFCLVVAENESLPGVLVPRASQDSPLKVLPEPVSFSEIVFAACLHVLDPVFVIVKYLAFPPETFLQLRFHSFAL